MLLFDFINIRVLTNFIEDVQDNSRYFETFKISEVKNQE